MGPTIILDKSTLQSLSSEELIVLNQLFYVNIPPILTVEILADLKQKTDESISENKVKSIANKLLQRDSAISTHYINILLSSLMGMDNLLDRRVLVPGSNKVIDKDGNIGFVFDETPEEIALKQWQKGMFSHAEKTLAEHWRYYIEEIKIEDIVEAWSCVKLIYPECNDLTKLTKIVDNLLSPQSLQSPMLVTLLEDFKVDSTLCSKIFYRFESSKTKSLIIFAPYVYYYLKTELFFKLGLMYNLLSTRKTNRIDLEYLFYLPFCHIFTSSDKFHKQIVPFFVQSDQTFIDGESLKNELQKVVIELNKIDTDILKNWQPIYKIEPTSDTSSIIFELWRKYLPNWNESKLFTKLDIVYNDVNELGKIREQANNSTILETDKFEKFKDSDTQFVVRKGYISLNDQCPCGSGKILKDCCYKK